MKSSIAGAAQAIFIGSCAGVLAILMARPEGPIFGLLILVFAILVAAARVLIGAKSRGDWSNPTVFPTLYIALVSLGPVAYVAMSGNPLGVLQPVHASAEVILVLGVFSAGFGLAASIGPTPVQARGDVGASRDWFTVKKIGQVIVIGSAISRSIDAVRFGGNYGENQFEYGVAAAVGTAVDVLVLPGVILVVMANLHISSPEGERPIILTRADTWVLAVFALGCLVTGQRAPLIGPVLFIVFAHHRWIKRIPLRLGLLLSAALALLFQYVGEVRGESDTSAAGHWKTTLRTLSSVDYVTAETQRRLTVADAMDVNTYVETMGALLPGPVVRVLNNGEPAQTGAVVFRDLVGFANPNQGYSYAIPAEALLNFGLIGVAVIAVILGGVMRWTYLRTPDLPSKTKDVMYPILFATLPYGLRSDALTGVKFVLYAVVVVAAVLAMARSSRFGQSDVRTGGRLSVAARSSASQELGGRG